MKEVEPKWRYTGSVFNEDHLNIRKFKNIMNFKEMCISARMAHLKYTISKINQAILLIHECVYTIYARLIRFEFIAHLNNMMTRQSQPAI